VRIGAHASCWKAADLRGAYPEQVSTELFERVGAAIGTKLGVRPRVMVAGDFRLSTPQLKDALSRGLMFTGARVLDAGQIPTPVAYFAASRSAVDAVLIVTASHNPANENGLKLLLNAKPPTPEELIELRELSEGGEFRSGEGTMESVDPEPDYERFMRERWRHLDATLLPTIILDAGNGAWSEIAPRVFSSLNLTVQCLSCTVDGSFPDRPSDCSQPGNLRTLRDLVRQQHAVGIAWDGDGDRMAAIDERGNAVTADQLSMLMARALLGSPAAYPAKNNCVVVDRKLASVVSDEVERLGGAPRLERTGHGFMRMRMLATGARLGLDACGHFFFGELEGADDGLFAALTLLHSMQQNRSSLGDLIKAQPEIHASPELRIPLALLSFAEAATRLGGGFPDAELERGDGIRLNLAESVVLLRLSGTEPVLSLRVEGRSAASYRSTLDRCVELLPEARASIAGQMRAHLGGGEQDGLPGNHNAC
jgi:phosphomannomutase/phosphoglucomutase